METLESLKSRLKGLVGVNTDDALAEIEKELRHDSRLYSEFLICKNKHGSINADYLKGVISDDERALRHARLLVSLLALLDKFGQQDLVSFKALTPADDTSLDDPAAAARPDGAAPRARGAAPAAPPRPSAAKLSRRLRWAAAALSLIVAAFFVFRGSLPAGAGRAPAEEKKPAAANAPHSTPPPPTSYVPSDFEVIERKSTLDFRAWRKVPLHLMKTDRFEPMIWRQTLRIEKKGDSKVFVVTHWSDAYTLDIACIAPVECVKRPPVEAPTKEGAAKYRLFRVEFDVSKYVLHEEFTIEYQTVYWNAYQKTESESVAFIASNPTRRVIFEIFFPDNVSDDLNFRFARRDENINYAKFDAPDAIYKNKHLVWRLDNPSLDVFYGVEWKWKKT